MIHTILLQVAEAHRSILGEDVCGGRPPVCRPYTGRWIAGTVLVPWSAYPGGALALMYRGEALPGGVAAAAAEIVRIADGTRPPHGVVVSAREAQHKKCTRMSLEWYGDSIFYGPLPSPNGPGVPALGDTPGDLPDHARTAWATCVVAAWLGVGRAIVLRDKEE